MRTVVTGQENKDVCENEGYSSPEHTEHEVLPTAGVTGIFDLHSGTRESGGLMFLKYWNLNDESPFHAEFTFSSRNIYVLGSLYGGPDFM